jgi:hypothetical protein
VTDGFAASAGLLGTKGLACDDCGLPEISNGAGEFGGDAEEKEDRRVDASSEFSKALWRFSIACFIESIRASTPNRMGGSSRGGSGDSLNCFAGSISDVAGYVGGGGR